MTTPPPSDFCHLADDGQWVEDNERKSQALVQSKQQSIADIDNAVASIYVRFTRFQAEYDIREKQAISFKKAKYKGDIPLQVKAFAEPAELTPKQATDIIFTQAKTLRTALEALGVLRMKKIGIKKLTTIDEVNIYRDDVLNQIKEIVEKL